MDIASEREADTLTLSPRGRIDGSNSADFQGTLLSSIEADSRVILNFAGIDYISSAGLRVILLVAQQLSGKDTAFGLCELSSSVAEVFRISGFDQIIKVFSTLDEAKSQLTG